MTAFRGCAGFACPELVALPGGSFEMGSPDTEPGRMPDEGPLHSVTIKPFAISRYLVTREEYLVFADATSRPPGEGCEKGNWRDPGFAQSPRDPIVCVSWDDAKAYVAWLSARTGKVYRLPTEAEYEYAERGGTKTLYWWGNSSAHACKMANIGDRSARAKHPDFDWTLSCSDGFAETSPVGAFPANPFGLFDATGNVWKWVEDCYHPSYDGAPSDGSAWVTEPCDKRVYRGSSWDNDQDYFRSARRYPAPASSRSWLVGIRVVRELP